MSEAADVNMTGTDTLTQNSPTENTKATSDSFQNDISQQSPEKLPPTSVIRPRLIIKNPPPKSIEKHSGTPFGLTRIGLPDGGFYIPSQIYQSKDFIDKTYCHPAGPVSTLLVTELRHFLSLNIYPRDEPTLLNPHKLSPPPFSITFPLWRQTAKCGAHLPTWPIIKAFLRQFRPCIDVASEAFKTFRPDDHAHMMLYHDHLIRAFPVAKNPGSRKSIWEDGYRTPFAKMRVSVNVDRGGSGDGGRLEDGMGEWFQEGTWKVVVFFGGWVGGRVVWLSEVEGGSEVCGMEESEEGDVWLLGKEVLFGNDGFVGQRIQVELFVPEVGYMGDDDDDVDEAVAAAL